MITNILDGKVFVVPKDSGMRNEHFATCFMKYIPNQSFANILLDNGLPDSANSCEHTGQWISIYPDSTFSIVNPVVNIIVAGYVTKIQDGTGGKYNWRKDGSLGDPSTRFKIGRAHV